MNNLQYISVAEAKMKPNLKLLTCMIESTLLYLIGSCQEDSGEHFKQQSGCANSQIECFLQSGECVEAQTNVDVIVDLEQFKQLLDSRLPLVFQGASVEEAELAWPGRGTDIPSPFP